MGCLSNSGMHRYFGLSASILPLLRPQGTMWGCISQTSSPVLPFPSPAMELVLLTVSRMGTGGHCSPQTLCHGSLAPGQFFGHVRWTSTQVLALSLSQPHQHSSRINPSLCSYVNGAENGFYALSIMEMGSS